MELYPLILLSFVIEKEDIHTTFVISCLQKTWCLSADIVKNMIIISISFDIVKHFILFKRQIINDIISFHRFSRVKILVFQTLIEVSNWWNNYPKLDNFHKNATMLMTLLHHYILIIFFFECHVIRCWEHALTWLIAKISTSSN